MRNWIAKACLSVGALMASTAIAAAQENYPTRQITMVVPYSAGGATDIIGRIVADGLRTELGQPVMRLDAALAAELNVAPPPVQPKEWDLVQRSIERTRKNLQHEEF